MKKRTLLFSTAALFLSAVMYSQVGINTPNPASTFDVTAKNATGTTTNVDGLLVPRVDRQRAQSMASVPTSTLIYVNSITTGTQTGTAVNIDAAGYYYYNGTVWTKLNPVSGADLVNIYNADGTLTGNRTVTQGASTLKFTGTAVNAFSVDGSAFSVDAANDRVGIGTAAPEHTFHVVSAAPKSNRFNLIDAAPGADNGSVLLALRNTSPLASNNFSLLGFTNNGPNARGAAWGIGSIRTGLATNGIDEDFFVGSSQGAGYNERMRISGDTGFVGIGTKTPQKLLHVNGPLQITNELNVGGTAAAAGSAGTSGQVLTSKGAGTAPAWSSLEDNGVVQLVTLAVKNGINPSNFAANNTFRVIYPSTPKIDPDKMAYDASTGVFTIKKAGYYQFISATTINMSLNPSGETAGTALTTISRSGNDFAFSNSGHGERTNDVYHTTAGVDFFKVGDTAYVSVNMTRNYRIGTCSLTITYLGN
ncbi:hypothetical protein M2347_000688 [Chryseobacterium sp. H1D6B]|uniref:hypothetical protein n=1 Tax=Chryseobacterium sp. H1D6B TaxID=2940588 RepID=UPI0015C9B302|nr:hypothetical protein [Chryseobacterium sp. H1D6B]MDH6250961.1 hypothetical protein [Chryseobacterium sp. H1D6B]